jgi:hypothetical protein
VIRKVISRETASKDAGPAVARMIGLDVEEADVIVVIQKIAEATAEVEVAAEAEITMIVEGVGNVQTVTDDEAGAVKEAIAETEDVAEDLGVDLTIGVLTVTEGIMEEMVVAAMTDIEMIVIETAKIEETTIVTTGTAVNEGVDDKRDADVIAEVVAERASLKTRKT